MDAAPPPPMGPQAAVGRLWPSTQLLLHAIDYSRAVFSFAAIILSATFMVMSMQNVSHATALPIITIVANVMAALLSIMAGRQLVFDKLTHHKCQVKLCQGLSHFPPLIPLGPVLMWIAGKASDGDSIGDLVPDPAFSTAAMAQTRPQARRRANDDDDDDDQCRGHTVDNDIEPTTMMPCLAVTAGEALAGVGPGSCPLASRPQCRSAANAVLSSWSFRATLVATMLEKTTFPVTKLLALHSTLLANAQIFLFTLILAAPEEVTTLPSEYRYVGIGAVASLVLYQAVSLIPSTFARPPGLGLFFTFCFIHDIAMVIGGLSAIGTCEGSTCISLGSGALATPAPTSKTATPTPATTPAPVSGGPYLYEVSWSGAVTLFAPVVVTPCILLSFIVGSYLEIVLPVLPSRGREVVLFLMHCLFLAPLTTAVTLLPAAIGAVVITVFLATPCLTIVAALCLAAGSEHPCEQPGLTMLHVFCDVVGDAFVDAAAKAINKYKAAGSRLQIAAATRQRDEKRRARNAERAARMNQKVDAEKLQERHQQVDDDDDEVEMLGRPGQVHVQPLGVPAIDDGVRHHNNHNGHNVVRDGLGTENAIAGLVDQETRQVLEDPTAAVPLPLFAESFALCHGLTAAELHVLNYFAALKKSKLTFEAVENENENENEGENAVADGNADAAASVGSARSSATDHSGDDTAAVADPAPPPDPNDPNVRRRVKLESIEQKHAVLMTQLSCLLTPYPTETSIPPNIENSPFEYMREYLVMSERSKPVIQRNYLQIFMDGADIQLPRLRHVDGGGGGGDDAMSGVKSPDELTRVQPFDIVSLDNHVELPAGTNIAETNPDGLMIDLNAESYPTALREGRAWLLSFAKRWRRFAPDLGHAAIHFALHNTRHHEMKMRFAVWGCFFGLIVSRVLLFISTLLEPAFNTNVPTTSLVCLGIRVVCWVALAALGPLVYRTVCRSAAFAIVLRDVSDPNARLRMVDAAMCIAAAYEHHVPSVLTAAVPHPVVSHIVIGDNVAPFLPATDIV